MDSRNPWRQISEVRIIGRAGRTQSLTEEGCRAAIGVGGRTDNRARINVFERAVASEVEAVTAVHPGPTCRLLRLPGGTRRDFRCDCRR